MYLPFSNSWKSLVAALLIATSATAQPLQSSKQESLPTDYLDASFHSGRRDALRAIMPSNSVMAVFAYPTRTFSNDVEYIYLANPDLYYFTGYREPHSLLLIFKEEQTDSAGNRFNELLFVQKKNASAEQWTGKRLGIEGAKVISGMSGVLNGNEFNKTAINFAAFDKIIFERFPIDIPDNPRIKPICMTW